MQRRPFGGSGLLVAPLGIGNPGPAEDGSDWQAVVRAYHALLDAGCNLVDTAQCYGRSEELIGRELAARRKDFVLVSKCGHHEVLADGSWRSRRIGMDDIDAALRRLSTDHLDAMLLHSYDLAPLQSGEALEVLRRAKAAGKLRLIGYSGDNERAAWAVAHGGIDVLECSLNLADQANVPTLEQAAARGIAVIAKRPLANAAWRHAGDPSKADPHHRVYAERFRDLALVPSAYGCAGMDELALRFTIGLPAAPCAIVGTRDPAKIAANLRQAAAGPLPAAAMAALRARFQQVGAAWEACN